MEICKNSCAHCELHNMLISLSLYKSPFFFLLNLVVFFCSTDNTEREDTLSKIKLLKNKIGVS